MQWKLQNLLMPFISLLQEKMSRDILKQAQAKDDLRGVKPVGVFRHLSSFISSLSAKLPKSLLEIAFTAASYIIPFAIAIGILFPTSSAILLPLVGVMFLTQLITRPLLVASSAKEAVGINVQAHKKESLCSTQLEYKFKPTLDNLNLLSVAIGNKQQKFINLCDMMIKKLTEALNLKNCRDAYATLRNFQGLVNTISPNDQLLMNNKIITDINECISDYGMLALIPNKSIKAMPPLTKEQQIVVKNLITAFTAIKNHLQPDFEINGDNIIASQQAIVAQPLVVYGFKHKIMRTLIERGPRATFEPSPRPVLQLTNG